MSKTRVPFIGLMLILALLISTTTLFAQTTKPSIHNDPNYKHFTGDDGGMMRGADPAFAKEIVLLVKNYPGISFDLPKKPDGLSRCFVETNGGTLIDGEQFEQLMIHAVEPDAQGSNVYVKLVAPLLPGLQASVLASNHPLKPAELLKLCLDSSNGNYPLAVLLAHNYTKNIAYKGRQAREKLAGLIAQGKPYKFPADIGGAAAHLVTMREKPGDKMGIYYHSFVPLVIATWTGSPNSADKAIVDEYLVRNLAWAKKQIPNAIGKYLPDMGSPPDSEKKQSDLNFAGAAHDIHNWRKPNPRVVVCHCSVTPARGDMSTKFKIDIEYEFQELTYSSEPVIEEVLRVTAPEFTRDLVNETKPVQLGSGFKFKKSFSFEPEVEGKHLFAYSFKGGKGFEETQGNKAFVVAADDERWKKMVGLWRTDTGGEIRISLSGNELTVKCVKLSNTNFRLKPGDTIIGHAVPTGKDSVHSNNAYSYAKIADNLKAHDRGTADLKISADGNTITGKRTMARYYDGAKDWDAGEIMQNMTWVRIGN